MQILQRLSKSNYLLLLRPTEKLKRSHSNDLFYNDCNNDAYPHSVVFCREKFLNSGFLAGSNKKQPYFLRAFYEVPDKYIKFLRFIIQAFSELKNDNIEYIESFCKELLKWCHTNQENQQYNMHFSLFFERILRDKLIRVKLTMEFFHRKS